MSMLLEISQDTENTLRAIRNLPVDLGRSSYVIEPYVEERLDIRTEKQLKAFTKRWSSAWKIPWIYDWSPTREERQLVSGRYNSAVALRCILKSGPDGPGCSHLLCNRHCISNDIMAPSFLLRIMEIRDRFGISERVAILQLVRAIHGDMHLLDPDDIL